MMASSLKEPNPVFIFEHVLLYLMEGDVDESAGQVDIAKAMVWREYCDVLLLPDGS
jgi:pyruvate/2-oxoglutarate/acetoin dehydrogenase E1 component